MAAPRTRLIAGVISIFALVLAIILGPRAAGAWRPSETTYPTQGIDVSHHQGRIEWPALPSQGVDFAYMKATEGGDHVDSRFAINWREAGAAGLRRGAYHFFTLCRGGRDHAANFIRNVPRDPGALAPAVDLEYLGNCGSRPSPRQVRKELSEFLALIEAHYGKPAILYLTKEFDEAYQNSTSFNRPLWLRSLIVEPRFGARPWAIWQASNFRRLKGIDGRVDWNAAAR